MHYQTTFENISGVLFSKLVAHLGVPELKLANVRNPHLVTETGGVFRSYAAPQSTCDQVVAYSAFSCFHILSSHRNELPNFSITVECLSFD
jgi:hypothetical protein